MSEYFTFSGTMVVEHCYKCKVAFAMTKEHNDRCRRTKESFYCPNGHGQVYAKSTESKLREQLHREEQRRIDAEEKATEAERRTEVELALHRHTKDRVSNGVCPCCNRYFEKLHRHMKSKHPDYVGSHAGRLRSFRNKQGLSQAKIAELIGVSPSSISKFERDVHLGEWVTESVTDWVDANL